MVTVNNNGPKPGQTNIDKPQAQAQELHKSNQQAANASINQASKGTDRVELSNQVKSLKSLEDNARKLPEVDSEKVASIKSAIENGDYEINFDRLAQAIEQFEGDL